MFGLGNNDDEERFWNFTMFHFWGTDKEFEEAGPIMIGLLVIVFVVGIIIYLIAK